MRMLTVNTCGTVTVLRQVAGYDQPTWTCPFWDIDRIHRCSANLPSRRQVGVLAQQFTIEATLLSHLSERFSVNHLW